MKMSKQMWEEIMFLCFTDPKIIPSYNEINDYGRYISKGESSLKINRLIKKRRSIDWIKANPSDWIRSEILNEYKDLPYSEIILKEI